MSRAISASRRLSPGVMPTRQDRRARNSARDAARNLRPFALRARDNTAGIAEKFGPGFLAVKEIEPLAAHRPEQGMTRHRLTVCDSDRVVAAEGRRIDFGMIGEGCAIAFIAEAPDGAVVAQFQFRPAEH